MKYQSIGVMCGSSEVIDCILFAVFGKVGGTCSGVIQESNTECHFFDEIDEVIYLPDHIGSKCLGESECDIRVYHDGDKYYFQYYDNGVLDESLSSEIDVSSLPERLTFKFLYRCATESDQGGISIIMTIFLHQFSRIHLKWNTFKIYRFRLW